MISKATIFLRRELQVWPNLDVEVSPGPLEKYESQLMSPLVLGHICALTYEIN